MPKWGGGEMMEGTTAKIARHDADDANSQEIAAHGGKVMKRIIIAGAPGSGKGTQCELLRERWVLWLRLHVVPGSSVSSLGDEIECQRVDEIGWRCRLAPKMAQFQGTRIWVAT